MPVGKRLYHTSNVMERVTPVNDGQSGKEFAADDRTSKPVSPWLENEGQLPKKLPFLCAGSG
jgi:hypothetical protein